MFERFTDRARRVVVLAQEEARMLNHNYIGTEHVLLGLVHEGEGVASKALESMNISLEAAFQKVEEIIGRGQARPTGHIPFTPRAKKVLELSLRESLQLDHSFIGTEHILLGLIREGEGVGAQVLRELGADLNRVRQTVIQLLSGYTGSVGEGVLAGSEQAGGWHPTPRGVLDARRAVGRWRVSCGIGSSSPHTLMSARIRCRSRCCSVVAAVRSCVASGGTRRILSRTSLVGPSTPKRTDRRSAVMAGVDPRGFEPLTSWLPAKRSTS